MLLHIFILHLALCAGSYQPSVVASSSTAATDENTKTAASNVTMVTFAQNEPFVTSLRNIERCVHEHNLADVFRGWTLETLSAAYPEYADVWSYPGRNNRPACDAWKPILILNAMNDSNYGDWVVWIDSSKYYPDGIQENIRDFVHKMDLHGIEVFPGHPVCGLMNVDASLISRETFKRMRADSPKYWFAPHFQINFVAFKKTQRNLAIINEWKDYNLDMEVACSSRVDDQALFSLLAIRHEIPFIHLCKFSENSMMNPHPDILKNVDFVVSSFMKDNTLWTLQTADSIHQEMAAKGWSPRGCAV
jgi:hypothetical protein